MRRSIRLLGGAALAAAITFGPATTASAAETCWKPTALPLPAGGVSGQVKATDHQGGYSGDVKFGDGSTHVVSWKNGAVTDHGAVRTNFLGPVRDQNRAGTIVGTETYGGGPGRPSKSRAIVARDGYWEHLPAPAGATSYWANDINDKGDIVGSYRDDKQDVIAVRWPADRPGTVEAVPGIPIDVNVEGLDEDGTVLFTMADASPSQQAPHLWRNGTITPLGKLSTVGDLRGYAISNGRVVGSLYFKDSSGQWVEHGVFWDKDGAPKALPKGKVGHSINRDGLSVGIADSTEGNGGGAWRAGAFATAFGNGSSAMTAGDNGTIGGSRQASGKDQPTVWRCG